MNKCEARQYSDQMQCDACGLVWDMNDVDPPECAPTVVHVKKGAAVGPSGTLPDVISTSDLEQNGQSPCEKILERLGLRTYS